MKAAHKTPITDQDVEDICLLYLFGAKDLNQAAHAFFDRQGITNFDRGSVDAIDLTRRLFAKLEEFEKKAHD